MAFAHEIRFISMGLPLVAMLVSGLGCQEGTKTVHHEQPPTEASPQSKVQKLKVSRLGSLTFNDSGADEIFSLASQVAHETSCSIDLARDGNITIFQSPNIVNSPQDLDDLLHQPGHVKVLNQINWCGEISPNILGCAPVPGDSLAVVRYQPPLEGILWLHEYGHNKGLWHRDNPDAVMNPTISPTRTKLTKEECTAFTRSSMLAAAAGPPTTSRDAASTDHPSMNSYDLQQRSSIKGPQPVEEFVRQVFIHGIPYEEAKKFGPNDIPTLLAMLEDEKNQEYWANIVIVLGMIGNDLTADRLIQFIESDGDQIVSPAQYRAKTSAIVSLGYLANDSKSTRALSYLQTKINPEKWEEEKKILWKSPFQANKAARDEQLSSMAILGLALSGAEEAGKTLEALKESAVTGPSGEFSRQVGSLVKEAIRTNKQVHDSGLTEYYRKRAKEFK